MPLFYSILFLPSFLFNKFYTVTILQVRVFWQKPDGVSQARCPVQVSQVGVGSFYCIYEAPVERGGVTCFPFLVPCARSKEGDGKLM